MTFVSGVDVSHWQTPGPALDRAVASTGARFAWVKASQGARSRDRRFAEHLARFGTMRLDRGGYHFYDFGASPTANADNFVGALRPHPLELRPVLDAEHGGAGSKAKTASALLGFLHRVEELLGITPVVYTYASWWNGAVAPDPAFLRFPLWIARYPNAYADGHHPGDGTWTAPAHPWPAAVAWQFSTAGNLDRNIAHEADYPRLRSGASAPTPIPGGTFTMDTEAKTRFDHLDAALKELADRTPSKAAPVRGPDGKVWIITESGRWHVPDMDTLDVLIFVGQVHGYGSKGVAKVDADFLDGIPVLPTLK